MRARGALASLLLASLILSGCGAGQGHGRTPSPTPAPSPTATAAAPSTLVAVSDGGILRLIDPVTGDERWHGGDRNASISAVAGAHAMFVSVTTADRSATEVLAVSFGDLMTERIGTFPGEVTAKTLAQDGTALYLLRYVRENGDIIPDGVEEMPVPARWQGATGGAPYAVGSALVAPDGHAWYRLDDTTLEMTERDAAGGQTVTRLALPAADTFTYSLLLAPDGRTLYVVNYRDGESIYVIDVGARVVVRSVTIRPGETTKQPGCAASLAPRGDRLYIAANNGRIGNGVDVIDAATMRRVANFTPERTFYCLAVSPDGNYLYGGSGSPYFAGQNVPMMSTINAHSGSEERVVRFPLDTTPFLTSAVTTR
jgi:YVTN family beta-propeller protein